MVEVGDQPPDHDVTRLPSTKSVAQVEGGHQTRGVHLGCIEEGVALERLLRGVGTCLDVSEVHGDTVRRRLHGRGHVTDHEHASAVLGDGGECVLIGLLSDSALVGWAHPHQLLEGAVAHHDQVISTRRDLADGPFVPGGAVLREVAGAEADRDRHRVALRHEVGVQTPRASLGDGCQGWLPVPGVGVSQ